MIHLTTEKLFTLLVKNIDINEFSEENLVELYQWVNFVVNEYSIISLAVKGKIKLTGFDEDGPTFDLAVSPSIVDEICEIGVECKDKYGEFKN